jgi:hypothetical protein
MNHASIIADRYLAIWNERDDITPRARIAQLFADGATYADPMMRGSGIDGIDGRPTRRSRATAPSTCCA